MPINPYQPYQPYYGQANYQPINYQPQPQQQSNNSSITWVQGETGAKSYLVGAGQSALLMDSEQSRFYIKSTDASGMPLPLRVFEYSEVTTQNDTAAPKTAAPEYVSRSEFDAFKENVSKILNQKPSNTKKVSEDKSNV